MNRKKRILMIEELDNNRGNKQMAMRTIGNLSKIAEVTVASLPNWFPVLPDNVTVEEYNITGAYKISQVTSLVRSVKHLKKALKLDKINHYDYIFFLSYHTVAIYLAKILFREYKTRVFITHHFNIDDLLSSSIKRFFFNRYVTKYNHFVFEPYVKDYFVLQYKVDKGKIYVLPYPKTKHEYLYQKDGEKYDCLGISSSNDEKWIQEIIEKEKVERMFEKNRITLLLRSKKYEYNNGYLKVINAYFTDEEYYSLYVNANCIILPFPKSFQYRMSGSIIDALSNGKKAILSDIPLFRDYAKRYPSICRVGISPDHIIEAIKKYKNEIETEQQNDDWIRFCSDHSDENICDCLKEAFSIE